MTQSIWSREQTSLLISLYKECESLYNTKHPDYASKLKRSEKFEYILKTMAEVRLGVTVREIKNKIRTLHNQLSKEHIKILNSKRGNVSSDKVYKPTLWCYNQIKFLLDLRYENKNSNLMESTGKDVDDIDDEDSEQETQIAKRLKPSSTTSDMQEQTIQVLNVAEEQRMLRVSQSQEEFCRFLFSELQKIKTEENFDDTKYEILEIVRKAIKKEQKTLANNSEICVCRIEDGKNVKLCHNKNEKTFKYPRISSTSDSPSIMSQQSMPFSSYESKLTSIFNNSPQLSSSSSPITAAESQKVKMSSEYYVDHIKVEEDV